MAKPSGEWAPSRQGATHPVSDELLAVYRRVGESACGVIEAGLATASRGWAQVDRFLDFGCGYGRVLREVVRRLPAGRVDAFDVDPQAVAFCREEFGVGGLPFGRPWAWETVGFGRYDAIWAGSVFTHLDEPYTREMLGLLGSLLTENGILVFTTHGDEAIRRAEAGFFLERVRGLAPSIREGYQRRGFVFVPYGDEELAHLPFSYARRSEFGMTWMSEPFVRGAVASAARLEVASFVPAGWEGVQDAVVARRSAGPTQAHLL